MQRKYRRGKDLAGKDRRGKDLVKKNRLGPARKRPTGKRPAEEKNGQRIKAVHVHYRIEAFLELRFRTLDTLIWFSRVFFKRIDFSVNKYMFGWVESGTPICNKKGESFACFPGQISWNWTFSWPCREKKLRHVYQASQCHVSTMNELHVVTPQNIGYLRWKKTVFFFLKQTMAMSIWWKFRSEMRMDPAYFRVKNSHFR